MKIRFKNNAELSKFSMVEFAKALGATEDQLPKADDYVIYIYDSEEKRFFIAKNEDSEKCYESFQEICNTYLEKAFKRNSPYTIQFPRGCFVTDENDEPCEDYGDLMIVWKHRKPFFIAQIQNKEYF